MTCTIYNIVKEGYVTNLTTAIVDNLTEAQILALYDGDSSTPAVTISGTASLGLLVEYGEAYDICYIDYYTDENTASNISINYGTTSGTTNVASISLHTSGVYRATISGIASFVELRHTLTAVVTNISQLDIISERLESVGFGSTADDYDEQLSLPHATVGALSATANVVTLFNDNGTAELVRVAIAPTFNKEDNYLYLATEEDGPYYGIDGYGFQQPGPDPMVLVDDPMTSDVEIHPQWVRREGVEKNSIYPTTEGVIIEAGFNGNQPSGYLSHTARGLLTKEYFTPHSFTVDVQVRFLGYSGNLSNYVDSFYFAMSNGFYLSDGTYFKSFLSDGRIGTSTVGVGMSGVTGNIGTTDTWQYNFVFVDGTPNNNPSSMDAPFVWGDLVADISHGGVNGAYEGRTNLTHNTGLEDILNVGQDLGAFTDNGEWHTLRLSYDHIKQEVAGFVDKIFISSAVFKADKFKSGVKFFIGSLATGGLRSQIRGFKLYPNKVYRQRDVASSSLGAVASATISGVSYNTQYINDGDASTVYIGPHPTSLAKVRIDFDTEYDIVNYKIQQQNPDDFPYPDRFGVTDWRTDIAVTSIVNYDSHTSYTNIYPPYQDAGDSLRLPTTRAPTWSGGAVTVSGVGYAEWQFVDYDRTLDNNNALIINNISVYAEFWEDILDIPEPVDMHKIPWFKGRWRNIRQHGASGALALRDTGRVSAAWWPRPEESQRGVNYGFSTAEYRSQILNGTYYHDFSEALFFQPENTHSGFYNEWYSEAQPEPTPFYIWRYFTEEIDVALIWVAGDNFVNKVGPKSFKFQYLKEGGNPNIDSDWVNIPPMVKPHPLTTRDADLRYGHYKQYKIDNNDGEYYTDVHLLPLSTVSDPGGVGSFYVGSSRTLGSTSRVLADIAPSGDRYTEGVVNNDDSSRAHQAIELDAPIRTRGIRLVVKNPCANTSTGASSNRFSLFEFQVWGTTGTGSYTSPVFDTGTAHNTERFSADLFTPTGTRSNVFVRSSPLPPSIRYDPEFEVWYPLGSLGDSGLSVVATDLYGRAITIGDETHFLISSPYVYNHTTDRWSKPYGGYPAHVEGGPQAGDMFDSDDLGSGVTATIEPDATVDNRAALVDNVIYMAAKETNNTGSLRILHLDLNRSAPVWDTLRTQRPPETANATMCAYGRRLYFFNEDGPIYYWDIVASNWVLLGVTMPTHGSSRKSPASILYNGSIYIFGADTTTSSGRRVDIFDPIAEVFTSAESAPRSMRKTQALLVGDAIYLITRNVLDANQRYYPDEGRWEVFNSLKWEMDYTVFNGSSAYFYFLYNGYMYKVGSGSRGLARALVSNSSWNHGDVPSPIDSVWGGSSVFTNVPWQRIDSLGELMPQNRYFQFKVDLHSEDRVNSPSLKNIKIVTPQVISIPASGTSNVYLKVQASEEGNFKTWYASAGITNRTANPIVNDWSLMYTSSPTPEGWPKPTTASGFVSDPLDSNNSGYAVRSPWVLPDGNSGYDIWFCRAHVPSPGHYYLEPPSIYYVNTKDPSDIATNNVTQQEVLPAGTLPQTVAAVWQPTVVLVSGTEYKMWFTSSEEGPLASIVDIGTQRIGYAESTDKVNWTNQQIVVGIAEDETFGYDTLGAHRPCVLFESGLYRLWYTGKGGDGLERILYRESTDGINWGAIHLHVDVSMQGIVDLWGVSKPHVLRDVDAYYLFYFGYDGTNTNIIRVQSSDGLDWVDPTVVMVGSGIHGNRDVNGVVDFFALIEREATTPGTVSVSAKLKIYNEGTIT